MLKFGQIDLLGLTRPHAKTVYARRAFGILVEHRYLPNDGVLLRLHAGIDLPDLKIAIEVWFEPEFLP